VIQDHDADSNTDCRAGIISRYSINAVNKVILPLTGSQYTVNKLDK
jgi:hypothetical protein